MNIAIRNFLQDDSGVTMVEYGLLAALIAVVSIAALTSLGSNVKEVFEKISQSLAAALA